jgi:hypothetical protein
MSVDPAAVGRARAARAQGEPEELKGLALLLRIPCRQLHCRAVIAIDGGQLLGEPGGG